MSRLTFTRALAAALVALTLTAAHAQTPDFSGVPAIGQKAPDFTLESLAGTPVRLSDALRHGPVVLVLLRGWPGYQCPFCVRQFGEFLGRAKDFEAAGARVVWVYPGPGDVAPHANAFVANTKVPANFELALDPDFAFTQAYHLRWNAANETSYPATFVLDRRGVIRWRQISTSHGGRAPVADVLSALASLSK